MDKSMKVCPSLHNTETTNTKRNDYQTTKKENLTNHKGKKYTSRVEKPGRYYLSQVTKLTSPVMG
jgi:hypothetical protein